MTARTNSEVRVKQSLQVERGVERVRELHQVGHIGRLNARVRRVERGIAGGAIVAFEL